MLGDLNKDPPKCLQKAVPSLSRMIAGPVRSRVGFEIRSVRIGFEMVRVTHGQFFFTSTIIFPFQRRSTKARRRFVCHRRHINLAIDGVFERALLKTRSETMIYDPVNSQSLGSLNL
jgi:hypothetical protein